MGQKKKNIKKVATEPKDHAYADVLAIVCSSLALYVGISLMSYVPSDPSFRTMTVGQHPYIHNLGGMIGSYLADACVFVWGYASYGFVLALLFVAGFLVFTPPKQKAWKPCMAWALMIWASSVILHMVQTQPGLLEWGGRVGQMTYASLHRYTGAYGTGLVLVITYFFALHWLVDMRLFHIFDGLSALGRRIRATWHAFIHAAGEKWTLQQEQWRSRRAQRKADRLRAKKLKRNMKAAQAPAPEPSVASAPKPDNVVELQSRPTSSSKAAPNTSAQDGPPIVIPEEPSENQAEDLPNRETVFEEKKKRSPFTMPTPALFEKREVKPMDIDQEALLANAKLLEQKLQDFGVEGKVMEVQPGPVVTMYEFEPAPGVKVNKITSLNDDLTLALRAMSVRIALIPGKSVIGIEVANPKREVVYIRDIIAHSKFEQNKSKLTLALGKDISGHPVVGDLRKMPHLLVAGATGSGKSVSINSMLVSVLYKATPEDVRMILVDPKMLELSMYDGIPHLLLPVVTDARKAAAALKWAVREMEKRYRLMADLGVRNIEGYNAKVESHMRKNPPASYEENMDVQPETHEGRMPFIMIVIDELADLMMVASKEVEDSIIRLAQMARASGIHLLLATQRPSVDVITGVIKANMPSRMSFQVSSKTDSRTILDTNGAEALLGAGDMLFMPPGTSKIQRLHGGFLSDEEVERITNFWKEQAQPEYNEEILAAPVGPDGIESSGDPEEDEMYRQAIDIVKERKVASISYIQRRLRIGYNRAARLVERMDDDGFLAPGESGKPREIDSSML